jgi:hypothetical protein
MQFAYQNISKRIRIYIGSAPLPLAKIFQNFFLSFFIEYRILIKIMAFNTPSLFYFVLYLEILRNFSNFFRG